MSIRLLKYYYCYTARYNTVIQAIYLYEDPNQNIIAQNLRLLLPHAVKWRIVANAFSISPDSLAKQETDEAYLHEILVECAKQPDFKFDNIVGRLNKEAEDEAEKTKQGSYIVMLIICMCRVSDDVYCMGYTYAYYGCAPSPTPTTPF